MSAAPRWNQKLEWTRVEDEMPPEFGTGQNSLPVICFTRTFPQGIHVGWYDFGNRTWKLDGMPDGAEVTHWMPSPKEPEEEVGIVYTRPGSSLKF